MNILTIIVGIIVSMSSVFAADFSDFERGFREGKNACSSPKEFWSCYLEFEDPIDTSRKLNITAEGFTRAEVLHAMILTCKDTPGYIPNFFVTPDRRSFCIEAVRKNQIKCRQL